MTLRLKREIEKLKGKFLEISASVERSVESMIRCVEEMDTQLAEKIIKWDQEIDSMEVELEEECLKVLALYQPVATDLRFIVAVLKINSDLERIADLSANIAGRIKSIAESGETKLPFDFRLMSAIMKVMLKDAIDALVSMDSRKAYLVMEQDRKIDMIHRKMYQKVKDIVEGNPHQIEHMISAVGISRYIERMADHITNIAEDVIYMVDGRIVRHSG